MIKALHVAALTALAAGPAAAAGAAEPVYGWGFNPLILLPLAAVAAAYVFGTERLAERARPVAAWRQTAFFIGLIALYAALQSPLDAMAGQLYWAHALQALILRIAGPMMVMLAAPQSALIAGLPRGWRRRIARAVPHQSALKRGLRWIARPLPAGLLFLLVFYGGELPPVQNASLGFAPLRALLTAAFLFTGLVFFATLLDPRDPPVAARYGHRVLMLIAATASQILIGAALTLKPMVLYTAYARLDGMTGLNDEASGGFIHWTPACLILLSGIILVTQHWNGAEERRWARAMGGGLSNYEMMMMMPQTAAELWLVVTPKNKRTALGLSLIPLIVFLMVFAAVFTVRAV